MASAGDIFICVEASVSTNIIEGVGEDPGLKSVARTTANPASIIARASGYRHEPRSATERELIRVNSQPHPVCARRLQNPPRLIDVESAALAKHVAESRQPFSRDERDHFVH